MTAFEPNSIRSYSQEDVQQILQLAIASHAENINREFSYKELLEIAAELEISPDSLKLAERDWQAQQSEVQQRQVFNLYRQSRFKKRLGNYAIVNVFFILVDVISGGSLSWSRYILLFCGLLLGLDIWNTFQTKGEEYERAFQRWNRKHQIKQTITSVVNKCFKALQT
ncbi:2TM domain-containing protein [Tolypothrix sp. FACHB-123]|uniref:2TM domain-containing protein n=1 Tax=Tolypothrix sp. FACHB-123 TaxID=2692868 RepID=UPI001684676E|nr:2TM domain-containing protein [Tolypothrix sp. FACHB-123]MBD2356587.1 2TM domain-containing protein [Tolypothrix sp. FACHB-123]